jgi:hypothetical protein
LSLLSLKRLTRDLMLEAQTELGMPLGWTAVSHFNTEHSISTLHKEVLERKNGRFALANLGIVLSLTLPNRYSSRLPRIQVIGNRSSNFAIRAAHGEELRTEAAETKGCPKLFRRLLLRQAVQCAEAQHEVDRMNADDRPVFE